VDDVLVVTGSAAVPVIVALVAALGQARPRVPRRCYPLMAIALGVAWNTAASYALGELTLSSPLAGIVIGLAASGLYSAAIKPGVRAITGGRA
jgi:hypothetical protein